MLLWLSLIQVECSAWGWAWVPHSILPAAPSPPGFWEEVVIGCSTLTSLLAKWFCAWMREWERSDADLRQVCVVSVFTFPSSKGADIPRMQGSLKRTSASPGCAVGVQWVWQSWPRAGTSSLCGTETCVPAQTLPSCVLGSWRVIQRTWEEQCCGFLQVICFTFSCS